MADQELREMREQTEVDTVARLMKQGVRAREISEKTRISMTRTLTLMIDANSRTRAVRGSDDLAE